MPARNINDLISNYDLSTYSLSEENWKDLAIGELSNGQKIIVAISSNSGIISVSRDGGTIWEQITVDSNNNWTAIAWSPLIHRFCVIAYDSNGFMVSNQITTLDGDINDVISFETRNFIDCPGVTSLIAPKSRWYSLIWVDNSDNYSETFDKYNSFLLTTRDSSYIFYSVIENGDIVDWRQTSNLQSEQELSQYNWIDLISTDIVDVNNRTASDYQFLALGTEANNARAVIAYSYCGNKGMAFSVTQPIDQIHTFTNIGYHHSYPTAIDEINRSNFVYLFSDDGSINYSTDLTSWTELNSLNSMTTNNLILSHSTVENYVRSAINQSNLIEVANDSERFALTSSDVTVGTIVVVTDTGRMYYVVDVNQLNTEDGYSRFYAIQSSEIMNIMNNMSIDLLITYDQIQSNLYEISQYTSDDVAITVRDILRDLRHLTQMNVPDNFYNVTVANDSERFALNSTRAPLGTIVRVTETEMLYEVVDEMQLDNENGYTGYGIPFYTLSKATIRNYLPYLSDTQLDNSLSYLQSTGLYGELTDEAKQQYISDIHDISGIEGTGIAAVPENIIDGMLDYIMRFYQNPDYDGSVDSPKYLYGIEDENIFDSNYAENTIFQNLYNEVLSDIRYNRLDRITQPIIEYIINFILAHQSECLTENLINNIITDVKGAVISYIESGTINSDVSMDTIDTIIYNITAEILNNSDYANIILNIKEIELLNLSQNGDFGWNKLYYFENIKKYIALSNSTIIAVSDNLTEWNFNLSTNMHDFVDLIYISDDVLNITKWVAIANESRYLSYSDDLISWSTSSPNDSSSSSSETYINKMQWSEYWHRLCVTYDTASPLMYFISFNDNNGELTLSWNTITMSHSYLIKSIDYSNVTNHFVYLTDTCDVLLSEITTGTTTENETLSYSLVNTQLANERPILLAVDRYNGDMCAITEAANIITADGLNEMQWTSRKLNQGLDILLSMGVTQKEMSDNTLSILPNVAILQKYGQAKTTIDLNNMTCRDLDSIYNWVAIAWSPTLQRFCAIDNRNIAITFGTLDDEITYSKLPYLSNEITDMTWLSGSLNVFMAITSKNEYIVSEDGQIWYKMFLNDYSLHSFVKYDEDLDKVFIGSRNSNSILVMHK